MRKTGRKGLLLAAACGAMLLTAGCKGVPMISGSGTSGCYTMPQTMIVVSSERNRYEEVYTDAIWDTQADGQPFQAYLLTQVEAFLENMKLMNLLAKEQSVELPAADQEKMNQAAEAYYSALTEADIQAMELSKDDAVLMFQEYCLANQLAESLTENMSLEVSDNEAKVIVIKEGRTSDAQAAQTAAAALAQEGADFDRVMSDAGISVEEISLGRGERDAGFEEAVFALETDQISGPLTDGDSQCFVQCVSSYDAEATKVRKDQIYEERRRNAFRQVFDQFGSQVQAEYPEGFFDGISFDGEAVAAGADFFEIYESYVGE